MFTVSGPSPALQQRDIWKLRRSVSPGVSWEMMTVGESQAGWKLQGKLWGARLVDSGHGKGRSSASEECFSRDSIPAGVTALGPHSNTVPSKTSQCPSTSKASQRDCLCQFVSLSLPEDGAASILSLTGVTDRTSKGTFLFLWSLKHSKV